jgi:flagellin
MTAVLNTNMASLYAQKNLSTAQTDLATSVQRLSSGKRINSAADDAAGFAVSEAIASTKNLTDQSIQNTQNAISMVQTASGALDVVGKILQRALTLTTEKEDGSLTTSQTNSINSEITSLLDEIGQINARTKFQGGSSSLFGTTQQFTTGDGSSTTVNIAGLSLGSLTGAAPASIKLGAVGTGWEDSNTVASPHNSDGPEFQVAATTSGSSEIRAGMHVLKNGVDTGLTVSFAHYISSANGGIDHYDGGGDTQAAFDIKTTAPAGDSSLNQTFSANDVITFAGGVASSSSQNASYTYGDPTITLSSPIPGLAIGNAIADSSGHFIGAVTAINGTSVSIDSTQNDSFSVPDGGWTNSSIHVMTTTATISADVSGGDSTISISAPNVNIVSGSVLTDRYGTYIGTVQSVNGTTVTLTQPFNDNIASDPSSGDLIQISSPLSASSNSAAFMNAIQTNSANQADLGTWTNRLNYIVDNMQTLSNNLASAGSRITDTNYAAETANLTRGQILQQAATSMLAQANQMPNVILTLLK